MPVNVHSYFEIPTRKHKYKKRKRKCYFRRTRPPPASFSPISHLLGLLFFSLIPPFPSCQGHWNNPLVPAIAPSSPSPSLRSSLPAAHPVFSEHPGEENCHVRSSGERIDTESVQTASDIRITEPAHIYSLQPRLSGCLSVCHMCVHVCTRLFFSFFFVNPFCMQAKLADKVTFLLCLGEAVGEDMCFPPG